MKIKCKIQRISTSYLLTSDRNTGNEDLVICNGSIYKRNQLAGVTLAMSSRIEASSGIKEDIFNVKKLPEYVIEAYDKGIRNFEIEIIEKIVGEPLFKMGLLEVTYSKPKRQTFTRDEVLEIMYRFEFANANTEDRSNWLDVNYS